MGEICDVKLYLLFLVVSKKILKESVPWVSRKALER